MNLCLYLLYTKKLMKLLVFTISIYFLFLALFPCSCKVKTTDTLESKTEYFSTINNETHSNLEVCTPFCACSSFHNPNFIVSSNFDSNYTTAIPVKTVSGCYDNVTSSYLDSLWRPPKA